MTRDVEKKAIVYFFDPSTRAFLSASSSGDSNDYTLPNNAVKFAPPEIPEGEYAKMNDTKTKWELKKILVTVIDDNGFVIEEINRVYPIAELVGKIIIESHSPKNYEKVRWNGSDWEDKPIPEELYQGKWNKTLQEWEEGLEELELASIIDRETYQLIQNWCIEQDKVEEYYLNKGIEDKTDPEYVVYKNQRSSIIISQGQKKIDVGV